MHHACTAVDGWDNAWQGSCGFGSWDARPCVDVRQYTGLYKAYTVIDNLCGLVEMECASRRGGCEGARESVCVCVCVCVCERERERARERYTGAATYG
jgi:hypothetical protein